MKETLLLIDGSSLAYRSFYAFSNRPLRNSKGMNTSAVYGFVKSLNMVVGEVNPDLIGIAFDLARPTFRHEIFREYKAKRKKMPDELSPQIPIIHDVVEAMGYRILEEEGLEADDIIYTLAEEGEKRGYSVIIFTFDKDLMQVVSENVRILNMRTKGVEWYDPDTVREKYGVPPEKIPDLLALAGDVSDNIPGIPGVGIKTAAKLIKRYGSLLDMVEHPEIIKEENIRNYIMRSRELVLSSYSLVKLERQEIPFTLEDLRPTEPDMDRLIKIYRELEFFSLLREMGVGESVSVKSGEVRGDVLSVVISGGEKPVFVISDGEYTQVVFDKGEMIDRINKFREIITSDIKELAHAIGFYPENKIYDLGIMDYLIHPNQRGHSLDKLVQRDFGLLLDKKSPDYFKILSIYAFKEREILLERIRESGMLKLLEEIEMPLSGVLYRMEKAGILFDLKFLRELSEYITEKLGEISERIYEIAGERFNLRSPKQLSRILFEKLGLPAGKKRKTHYSTDAETLSKLAGEYEIAGLLLKYRELEKLRSSYTDALPLMVNPETGRIHCKFNQTVAATGRLSASEPNLQTIPIRGELGREIRKAVIAEHGFKILSCDYSQIELRILAHFTGDKRLRQAFIEGRDVHAETAAIIFGVPQSDVTGEMRRVAKVVNFGLMYGMSPYGLAKELNISQAEAQAFIDSYFAEFSGVRDWVESITDFAKQNGYVETLFGRRRAVPELLVKGTEEYGRRVAINTPIQGTAADIIKKAMIEIDKLLKDRKTRMILQIHDELLFEIAEGEEGLMEDIKNIMEHVVELDVPLVVDANIGKNWAEAH
ncbi:DNA polymerase I [bacterium]|nr:MAG: DNA polymerase I [bacterium]